MNGDIIKKTAPNRMKIGIAAIFTAIGVFGSFMLIMDLSSGGGVGWITGMALCGLLVIYFGDVIDSFDFWNLKVQLRKVEDTRIEIENREKRINELALLVADLVEAGDKGSWKDEHYGHEEFEAALSRIRNFQDNEQGADGDADESV